MAIVSRSEEERAAAILAIDGNKWKNTTLKAKVNHSAFRQIKFKKY